MTGLSFLRAYAGMRINGIPHAYSLLRSAYHLMKTRGAQWLFVPGAAALLCPMGEKCLFSLPVSASEEASDRLVSEMVRTAKKRGFKLLQGPVSPEVCDFNRGLRIRGDGTSPYDEPACPGLCGALISRDFEQEKVYDLYTVKADSRMLKAQRRVAEEAARRFSLRGVSFADLGHRAAVRAMARVTRWEPDMALTDAQASGLMASLGRALDGRLSQAVFHGDEPVAYLLVTAKGGVRRAVTAQVAPTFQRRGVTAMLAVPVIEALDGEDMEIGVIAGDNLPSLTCVRALGARCAASYARFRLRLDKE